IMKKLFLLMSAVAAVSFSLVSCDNDKGVRPQAEEYVEVRFQANNLEFSASPITKSAPGEGLYGVQIRNRGPYTFFDTYACWLTDDLSSQSFKLIKGNIYDINVVYVPDAKDIIENEDGYYGAPFNNGELVLGYHAPQLGHDIYYGKSVDIGAAGSGIAQRKGEPANKYFSDVPLFSGGKPYFTAEEDVTLDINLYSCMFGLAVTVENLKEGKVHIYHGSYTINSYAAAVKNGERIFTLTNSSNSMDVELEMPSIPFGRDDYGMNNECWTPCWINIDYEDPDGNVLALYSKDLEVYRMYKYSLTFDLDEVLNSVTGGLKVNMMDEKWVNRSLDM
ncbi:MAG: hypothetical protein J6U22_10600, partial [Bacteroidaceae bacterium]|nr:hypothetical protein [Bacteroidaceae bacterium]